MIARASRLALSQVRRSISCGLTMTSPVADLNHRSSAHSLRNRYPVPITRMLDHAISGSEQRPPPPTHHVGSMRDYGAAQHGQRAAILAEAENCIRRLGEQRRRAGVRRTCRSGARSSTQGYSRRSRCDSELGSLTILVARRDAAPPWKPWPSHAEAVRGRAAIGGPGTGRACHQDRPPRGGGEPR